MDVLGDKDFAALMKKHVYECLDYILKKGENFSVLSNLKYTKFDPALPDEVAPKTSAVLFSLGGYTLESASLSKDALTFEAGFGEQNFASFVQIPLGAVFQIIAGESVLLVNFALYEEKDAASKTEHSKQKFLSNPKNKAIFGEK